MRSLCIVPPTDFVREHDSGIHLKLMQQLFVGYRYRKAIHLTQAE